MPLFPPVAFFRKACIIISMKSYRFHKFMMALLRIIAAPFVAGVMRYRFRRFRGPESPSIIISNHNTNLDPALVAMAFSRHMYFLSSEHAFRGGFPSKVLKAVFNPIALNKAVIDIVATKEMLRRLKAGANVCLFAEGDRSFTGLTGPISISTAKFVKASGAQLITFRIEGGYLTSPRWSRTMRKGKMRGDVVGVYDAVQLKTMTDEEVLSIITKDTFEDAYARQADWMMEYKGKDLAENIETALYMCPVCKKVATIHSEGNRLYCSCGFGAVYSETGFLEGEKTPFKTITEWGQWQEAQLEEVISSITDGPLCSDDGQSLFAVQAAKEAVLESEGSMYIDRQSFHCAGRTFKLSELARFAVTGQMTLQFALKDGTTFEIKSSHPRSALKYRDIFHLLTGKT